MSPGEVLALARSQGVILWAGTSGQLRWRCVRPLSDDLRNLLVEHKSSLLAMLPPPWDQADAERLLGEARATVASAEAEHKARRITAVRLNVIRIWLEVVEGYMRDHAMEATRGWDVIPLLRSAVQRAHRAASREVPLELTLSLDRRDNNHRGESKEYDCLLATSRAHEGKYQQKARTTLMPHDLIVVKVDRARALLAEASNAQEAKTVADMAKAAEVYAKRQKLSEEIIDHAHAIKIDALTLLGEFLEAAKKNVGTRRQLNGKSSGRVKITPPEDTVPTYEELGIDKNTAKEVRAAIGDEKGIPRPA